MCYTNIRPTNTKRKIFYKVVIEILNEGIWSVFTGIKYEIGREYQAKYMARNPHRNKNEWWKTRVHSPIDKSHKEIIGFGLFGNVRDARTYMNNLTTYERRRSSVEYKIAKVKGENVKYRANIGYIFYFYDRHQIRSLTCYLAKKMTILKILED